MNDVRDRLERVRKLCECPLDESPTLEKIIDVLGTAENLSSTDRQGLAHMAAKILERVRGNESEHLRSIELICDAVQRDICPGPPQRRYLELCLVVATKRGTFRLTAPRATALVETMVKIMCDKNLKYFENEILRKIAAELAGWKENSVYGNRSGSNSIL